MSDEAKRSFQRLHDEPPLDPATAIENAGQADLGAIEQFLRDCELPTAGVTDQFPRAYVVVRSAGELVAVAGLEIHGHVGLLRSVAVRPAQRSLGLGRRLVEHLLRVAADRDLDSVYLLTTTAPEYFRRLGFIDAERAQAPAELRASPEFLSVCPSSAVCLVTTYHRSATHSRRSW